MRTMASPLKNVSEPKPAPSTAKEPRPKEWKGYDQSIDGEPKDVVPDSPPALPWPAVQNGHSPMKNLK